MPSCNNHALSAQLLQGCCGCFHFGHITNSQAGKRRGFIDVRCNDRSQRKKAVFQYLQTIGRDEFGAGR